MELDFKVLARYRLFALLLASESHKMGLISEENYKEFLLENFKQFTSPTEKDRQD